jgi:type IV secretion system protein TrbL
VPAGQTVTTYQAFCIALAALLLMALSLVASRLATDMIIGGPSLGVGTAINTTAAAINTTTAAGRSRAAVMAVKMAAAVPTKGVMLAATVGTAAVRKITGNGGSAGNKTGATAASVVSGSTAAQAGSTTTAANTAGRVPGSSSPKGTSGPTNTGGTPT